MSDFVEIQMDKTTLPTPGFDVEWENLNGDIRFGTYSTDEGGMFSDEYGSWDFAWHVVKWRYI